MEKQTQKGRAAQVRLVRRDGETLGQKGRRVIELWCWCGNDAAFGVQRCCDRAPAIEASYYGVEQSAGCWLRGDGAELQTESSATEGFWASKQRQRSAVAR
ncbi:hypothetical protein ACJRO7_031651 [Eucalyptus globulus]|uniref:Uncharacterized protein n=1 Tax=Eucalyptus globulus TaxID=34317 RepID=A0ABD3JH48_EUCGL